MAYDSQIVRAKENPKLNHGEPSQGQASGSNQSHFGVKKVRFCEQFRKFHLDVINNIRKAVVSEENNFPTTANGVGKHAYTTYSQLLIVFTIYNEWLQSINYFKGKPLKTQTEPRKDLFFTCFKGR